MTQSDYNLLLHICNYTLRKGSDLNKDQISDIDRIIKKIYSEQQTRDKSHANLRNQKMGKRKRLHSK